MRQILSLISLEHRGLSFDLVVVGGGALLLQNLIRRPTLDLDAIARVEAGEWLTAKPLPEPLVQAIRDVADAMGLSREPQDEKDWLNGGPLSCGGSAFPRALPAAPLRGDSVLSRSASPPDWISSASSSGPPPTAQEAHAGPSTSLIFASLGRAFGGGQDEIHLAAV